MISDYTLQYSKWRSGHEFDFLIYCGIGPKYVSVIEMDIQSILIVYSIFYNVFDFTHFQMDMGQKAILWNSIFVKQANKK